MDDRNAAEHGRTEEVTSQSEILSRQVEELSARLEATLTELKEKEGKLSESEERFRIIFEKAKLGMAHVALDGRWLRVNNKLLEIVCYQKKELLGLSFQEITHPDDRQADLRYVRRMLSGKMRCYSAERRYVRKDGRRIWVYISVSLVHGPSGEPKHFIVMTEDITDRKLAELIPELLVDREMEVLRLIAQRQTNRQIAQKLAYSEATVKLYVQRILAKLGVAKRAEAARHAIEIGLLAPSASQASKAPANPPNRRGNYATAKKY